MNVGPPIDEVYTLYERR